MRLKILAIIAISAGLILCPFLSSVHAAPADEVTALNKEIEARKTKIKQLEDTMAKYQKNIDQNQLQAVSLKNQLEILNNRLAQLETDVSLTEERIQQAKLEIQALELSIKDKETVMTRQKLIIAKMVQSIHSDDQKNYVEILLTNNDFSEFFNQAKYLENVYTDLGRSVKTLRLIKEDLDGKKKLVEARRQKYEDLKTELENKKKDLGEQMGYKQNFLNQTKASEAKFRTLLSSLKQQAQAVEGEVRSYEDQVRKKLEQQNKIEEDGTTQISWPLSSHYITATFHDPDYPFRKVMEHSGIDIRASQGTPVRAAASGYIARAKRCTLASCYAYVLIVHTGNLSTLYGHLSVISVADDQYVNKGDIIGNSGATPGTPGAGPFVTGPHLHFEVRANGIPVNPLGYLIQ